MLLKSIVGTFKGWPSLRQLYIALRKLLNDTKQSNIIFLCEIETLFFSTISKLFLLTLSLMTSLFPLLVRLVASFLFVLITSISPSLYLTNLSFMPPSSMIQTLMLGTSLKSKIYCHNRIKQSMKV